MNSARHAWKLKTMPTAPASTEARIIAAGHDAAEAPAQRTIAAPRRTIVIRPAGGSWTNIRQHFSNLRDYRDLLYTLSAHRVSVRYRQTMLGVLWAVLQPLLMMVIFTTVFSFVAPMPSDGAPYALFAYVALLPWTFFSTAFSNATGSLVNHSQLITKVYFPREILPATYVIAALFDFAVGLVVLMMLMSWYSFPLTASAWLLVLVVVLLVAWTMAASLITSVIQVRWRDVGVALPLVVQLWLFASPVIYPLSAVPATWRPWYLLNPMAGIIGAFRDVLLHGRSPEPVPLVYSLIVTLVTLPIAYAIFKRSEATMADVI
jgi:homopolymeric O-antigen transport system permease protein